MLAVGTITVNSPLTGTAGLIKAGNGTLNVNGSLAGLSGTFTHASGTTTLNVPYTDNIDIVNGTFNLRANLTTPGKTLTLGNPDTPANTVGSAVNLNIQSTAVTTIAANLVVANGTNPTATTFTATLSQQGGSAGIVQDFQGSVTLNGPLSIGGGGNTVNTLLFEGPLSGSGALRVQNGTVRFTSTATNYNGPFILGNGGNTTLVTFDGINASTTGTVTIGFGTGVVTSTRVRLSNPNAIPGGQITMQGGTLQPTASMTLPNAFLFSGGTNSASPSPAAIDVGTGLSVNLSGPLASDPGTYMTVSKVNPGRLALTGNSPAYTGNFAVLAGTLAVNANVSAANVTVASGATLQGTGILTSPVAVSSGGTLKGGDSLGVLTVAGNVSLIADTTAANGSTLRVDGTPTAHSEVFVTGASSTFNLNGLTGSNRFTIQIGGSTLVQGTSYTWELVNTQDNPAGLLVNGITGTGQVIPSTNYVLTSADFAGFSNVSLIANPSSLVLTFTPAPEPAFVLLTCGAIAGGLAACRRRRALVK
jgi:autotransporter-associated beta strand protein